MYLLDVLRRSDLKIDPHVMMDTFKDGVGLGSTGEMKRVVCGAVDPDGTRVMLCRADDTVVLINTVTGHIKAHKVRLDGEMMAKFSTRGDSDIGTFTCCELSDGVGLGTGIAAAGTHSGFFWMARVHRDLSIEVLPPHMYAGWCVCV